MKGICAVVWDSTKSCVSMGVLITFMFINSSLFYPVDRCGTVIDFMSSRGDTIPRKNDTSLID